MYTLYLIPASALVHKLLVIVDKLGLGVLVPLREINLGRVLQTAPVERTVNQAPLASNTLALQAC